MKNRFIILALAIFLPFSAAAADFTASVDSDHVEAGENFTLKLTLSGTKAKAGPEVAALKQSFTVVSEVHSANATGTDHAVNYNVDWQLALLPKREGELTIPSVAIETAAGRLHTAQITLHVGRLSPPIPSQVSSEGSKVSISAKANTTTPYRNQPIRYTVRCVVQGFVSKVSVEDISVANAIVERQGKPVISDQVQNGVPVRVVELNYLITPLQPGRMIIPPAVLKGELKTPALAPMIDPFGGQFMLSPRAQQAMNFFSAYSGQPFAVASNQTTLDVKPSVGAMDPWLPLRSLQIKEDTSAAQLIHVGDLVTRKIKLLAEGVVGTQLPNLEAQQNHGDFGVYADKPATGEDVDGKTGAIIGWRNESYSLIPQRAGRLVLPAVKVTWWDVVNKKIATTELPARSIVVLPSVAIATPAGRISTAGKDVNTARVLRSKTATLLAYGFAAALAVVLLFCAAWVWRFRQSPAVSAAAPQAKKINIRRTLKNIRTMEELRDFLRAHGQERLGKPANASLEDTFCAPPDWWTERNRAEIDAIIAGINAALYAGRPSDLEDLKKRSRRIIAALGKGATSRRKAWEQLPILNPS